MARLISEHDKMVRRVAAGYLAQGYRVKADIIGYPRPPTVCGRRADVTASKRGDRVMVEVETERSFFEDQSQRRMLRRCAHRNGGRFRTVVV